MLDVVLDRNEWRSFCKYLGKDPKSVRLRSFFPKGHHLKERDHGKKYHADSGWIQKCQNELLRTGTRKYVNFRRGLNDGDYSIICSP